MVRREVRRRVLCCIVRRNSCRELQVAIIERLTVKKFGDNLYGRLIVELILCVVLWMAGGLRVLSIPYRSQS